MIRIPVTTIIERVKEKTGMPEKDIRKKIDEKLKQLSGLISEEGAAHIVANELGVKVMEEQGALKIKDILPGMKNVEVAGKVVAVYDIKEFNKEGKVGKVGSFLIGDETGLLRVVCWNDKTDAIKTIEKDMVVKIESGYVKESMNGRNEVHMGDRSTLVLNPKGVKIETRPARAEGGSNYAPATRKKISELSANENNVEIMGTIVQVFDPKYFLVDAETGKKVTERNGSYYLDDKKVDNTTYSYVTNLFLDDGTDNIRVVLWKNQTQKLFGVSDDSMQTKKDGSFEDIKNDLLGKIVKVVGRTNRNEMFDRIEFISQLVFTDPNPEEEIDRLKGERKEHKPAKSEKASAPAPSPKPAPRKEEPKPAPAPKKKASESADEDILSLEDLEELEDLDEQ